MHIYLEILGMKSILVKLTILLINKRKNIIFNIILIIFYIEILILILRILLEKQIM